MSASMYVDHKEAVLQLYQGTGIVYSGIMKLFVSAILL